MLAGFLEAAGRDHRLIPLDRTFPLDQISDAHAYMEADRAVGKLVVIP